MTWWKNNAVHKKLRPVIFCRNSAETGQENSIKTPKEKCREFAKKFGHDEEMRPRFQDTNYRRTKS